MTNKKLKWFSLLPITVLGLTSHLYGANSEAHFTATFVKPGDKVFDVGAHEGKMTDLYLYCGASQVICIEPQPSCVNGLREKFRNDNRVIIIGNGLASKPGKMKLHICPGCTCVSSFSDDWIYHSRFSSNPAVWSQTLTIEMTTLDELIKCYGIPQFCKIDVENFEYEVLSALSQPIPLLSFEFHIEFIENARKCLEKLISLGYNQFNFAVGAIYKFALNDWVGADKLLIQIQSGEFRPTEGPLWGDIYARYLPEKQ